MLGERSRAGVGLVGAGRLRFATAGLYGLVRHPRYLGIFLAVFGQLVHWPTLPTLVLFPLIVWAYWSLARREEARMIEEFGDAYREYRERVPMFFPRGGRWGELWERARPPARKPGPEGAKG